MVIFLYGDDSYRSRHHLKKLMERFRAERDPQGCNVDVIDVGFIPASEILSRAFASPFLAEKRMVVLLSFLSAGEPELQEAFLERLRAGLPDDLVFVFWESVAMVKKSELFNALKKEKYAQEFAPLTGARLVAWIVEEVAARGAVLAPGAVEKMAEGCSDTFEAMHLVNQLVALVAREKRPITVDDVGQFGEVKIDDDIFALVDAIGSRDKKRALKLLEEQWRQRVNDQYLFSMLVRQFRLVASVAAARDELEKASSNDIAQHLGLHPFVVKKTLALVPRYTSKDLSSAYQELIEMDRAVKTGRGEMDVMMTAFVSRL